MNRRRSILPVLLLLIVLVPLSLLVSWKFAHLGWGPQFAPHPDCLEYAAGAQSLATSGEYFLQVGAHRVPPRYPPGWPLLLSLALRCGVTPTSLWWGTAVCNALVSFLIALMTLRAARFLQRQITGDPVRQDTVQAWITGLLAGLLWALSPQVVFLSLTLLSDLPALLFILLFGRLFLAGLDRTREKRPAPAGLWVVCGLILSLTATIRFIHVVLAVPALLLLCAGYWRSFNRRSAIQALGWLSLGWVVGLVAVSLLSQLPPWHWSNYSYWIPEFYADFSDTFRLSYALHGNPKLAMGIPLRLDPHLVRIARMLAGTSQQHPIFLLGHWWPLLGWFGLAAAALVLPKHGSGQRVRWLAGSLAVWVLGHAAFYAVYFALVSRYFLAPMAICIGSLAVGLHCLISKYPYATVRVGARALMIATVVLAVADLDRIPEPRDFRQPTDELKSAHGAWVGMGAEERAERDLPFDPVYAQAMGLLGPQIIDGIGAWGKLPRTSHVLRLVGIGVIKKREISGETYPLKKPLRPRRSGGVKTSKN